MTDNNQDVQYKPIAENSAKSCTNCKNFQSETEGIGKCFGHDVSAKGTCNFFTSKS